MPVAAFFTCNIISPGLPAVKGETDKNPAVFAAEFWLIFRSRVCFFFFLGLWLDPCGRKCYFINRPVLLFSFYKGGAAAFQAAEVAAAAGPLNW